MKYLKRFNENKGIEFHHLFREMLSELVCDNLIVSVMYDNINKIDLYIMTHDFKAFDIGKYKDDVEQVIHYMKGEGYATLISSYFDDPLASKSINNLCVSEKLDDILKNSKESNVYVLEFR